MKDKSKGTGKKSDATAPTIKLLEDAMKAVGKFEAVEIEARVEEAFKAVRGKVIKHYMSGDMKISCEILVTVDSTDRWSTRIAFPLSMPLDQQTLAKVSPALMV